ncbi:F-box protein [Legionella sp. CNM-1927-20]|uniref:F-box protein n=1 Tax=Legionella sp. CNM-1927-20 TaxID=3422221 RepID=UPI00403B0CCB
MNNLPKEIRLYMFSFFTRQQLGRLASVSKQIKEEVEDDCLWKEQFITKDLKQYLGLSAKELVKKYNPLFQLPGNNLLARLAHNELSLVDLQKKLNSCIDLEYIDYNFPLPVYFIDATKLDTVKSIWVTRHVQSLINKCQIEFYEYTLQMKHIRQSLFTAYEYMARFMEDTLCLFIKASSIDQVRICCEGLQNFYHGSNILNMIINHKKTFDIIIETPEKKFQFSNKHPYSFFYSQEDELFLIDNIQKRKIILTEDFEDRKNKLLKLIDLGNDEQELSQAELKSILEEITQSCPEIVKSRDYSSLSSPLMVINATDDCYSELVSFKDELNYNIVGIIPGDFSCKKLRAESEQVGFTGKETKLFEILYTLTEIALPPKLKPVLKIKHEEKVPDTSRFCQII